MVAWVSQILKPMWQGTKIVANKWSHLCAGEGVSLMQNSLSQSFKANGLNNFSTTVKSAWKAVPETGGTSVFKNIGKNLFGPKTWCADLKSVGVLKALGKRIPAIGSLLCIAFEIPNIISAFTHKDGGVVTSTTEIGKAATRLGCGMAGMAAGAAIGSCIPVAGNVAGAIIGFIAGAIGFSAGDWVGSKIVGKSFTEKQEEKQQQLAQAQQMQVQQMPSLGALAQQYAQAQQQIAQNPMMSNPMYNNCFTQNPFATNQQQFKSLAQMYQEYSMMQQMLAQQAMMQQCGNWGCIA